MAEQGRLEPVPEVVEEEGDGLGALFLAAGLPDNALAQLEDAPEDDEHQHDDAQPKGSAPHSAQPGEQHSPNQHLRHAELCSRHKCFAASSSFFLNRQVSCASHYLLDAGCSFPRLDKGIAVWPCEVFSKMYTPVCVVGVCLVVVIGHSRSKDDQQDAEDGSVGEVAHALHGEGEHHLQTMPHSV